MPVTRRQDHGAVVLSVSAPVDGGLLSKLTSHLRRAPAGQPVIIDLSALTLGHAEMLQQLVLFLRSLSGSDVCFVCSRLSARRLLRLAGAADIVPIFMSTADAIQALLFHEDGYGLGWSMGDSADLAAAPSPSALAEDAGARQPLRSGARTHARWHPREGVGLRRQQGGSTNGEREG